MTTQYKKDLSKLTGTMGPQGSAGWPNTGKVNGKIYDMGAAPLIYDTITGKYNTAYEATAYKDSPSFANFSFGRRKRWVAPKRGTQRSGMFKRCGSRCFLDPGNLKYPICKKNCSISKLGLMAAYKRAKQYHRKSIAKKAKKMSMKKLKYSFGRKSKRNHKRKSKRSRKNKSKRRV